MNYRKWISLSSIILFSFILVTKYQNCGQAPGAVDAEDYIQSPEEPLPVDYIDPQMQTKVAFVEDYVEISNESDDLDLDGLCDSNQHGALLAWQVLDTNGFIMAKGRVLCDKGAFQLSLKAMKDLNCGEEFDLVASLGARAKDHLVVFRRCAPQQKIKDTTITRDYASGGGECFIEKDDQSCEVVCYENGRVKMDDRLRSMSCEI